MNNQERIEEVKKFVIENMSMEKYESHNFDHSLRVLENARQIIKLENDQSLNILVIETAALIHDMVDHKFCDDVPKQEASIKEKLKSLGYSEDDINAILYAINNISYSKGVIPEGKEGKILQDADRLDALQAFSIVRPFTYSVKVNRPFYNNEISALSHYIEKKLKVEGLLNTQGAKQIAAKKGKITYIYLAYLLDELPDDIYEKKAFKKELEEFYRKYKNIIPKELIPKEYLYEEER